MGVQGGMVWGSERLPPGALRAAPPAREERCRCWEWHWKLPLLFWYGGKHPLLHSPVLPQVRTEAAARKLLSDRGVGHYWDLCAAFTPE